MRTIIFANGEFQQPVQPLEIQENDLVIAANGGSRHCLELGITPAVLIGDLDSTEKDCLEFWQGAGVEIIQHPKDKDQTDLELALLLAQNRGAQEITIYGAIGGRLDMTLGNLIMLAHPALRIPITLVNGSEEIHLLRPGEALRLVGNPGEIVSLIPIRPGFSIVTTIGLLYALTNDPLEFGHTRGISNQLIEPTGKISLESGLLVVIHTRKTLLEKE